MTYSSKYTIDVRVRELLTFMDLYAKFKSIFYSQWLSMHFNYISKYLNYTSLKSRQTSTIKEVVIYKYSPVMASECSFSGVLHNLTRPMRVINENIFYLHSSAKHLASCKRQLAPNPQMLVYSVLLI